MIEKNRSLMNLPFILFFVIHIIGSYSVLYHISFGSDIFRAVLMSMLAFMVGEGYGIISFLNASGEDKTSRWILTIILCITSSFACVVGYFITGIESTNCKWMTVCLIILNIGVLLASIVKMVKRA